MSFAAGLETYPPPPPRYARSASPVKNGGGFDQPLGLPLKPSFLKPGLALKGFLA